MLFIARVNFSSVLSRFFWIRKFLIFISQLIFRLFFYPVSVRKNTYHFQSFDGAFICDSPWFLYEELERRVPGNFVWVVKDLACFDKNRFIGKSNVKFVEYGTFHYYVSLASASFILSNSRLPYFFHKRSCQKYIQTWHGTPLKRLGFDIKGDTNGFTSNKAIKLAYKVEGDNIDLFVSPSSFASDKFCSSFNIDKTKILELGYPRNDILVRNAHDSEHINKIKEKYNIPINSKIILYAPTYRDNSVDKQGIYYSENPLDAMDFTRYFSDDIVFLLRGHYFSHVKNASNRFIDVSCVDEVAELYLISDILITDYSSVFFDFAILNKPIYFYMPDLFEYKNKIRGFYLEVPDALPGPVLYDVESLANMILNDNFLKCDHDVFNQKYNPHEDGKSSARYVDYILNINTGNVDE